MGRPATVLAIAVAAAIAACTSDRISAPGTLPSAARQDLSAVELSVDTASVTDSTASVTDSTASVTDSTASATDSSAAPEWLDSAYTAGGEPAGQLLACPGPTAGPTLTSKWIGPEGGRIENGPFRLNIPAGALAETRLVTLTRPGLDLLVIEATVGDSAHYQFATPVAFVVRLAKYCPDVSAEMVRKLQGVWIDAPDGVRTLRSKRDPSLGKVKFSTDHFSSYGIAW